MTTRTSPPLAQELHDYIIDHLHDDRKSLANCSQVCRDWLPTSTLHLFSALHTRIIGLQGTLSGMPDFYCILDYPRVAMNIRELHITNHGTMFIEIAQMREILPALVNLRDLFCEDVGFLLKGPRVMEPVRRPKLASLHILNPTFPASISFLIMSFAEIRVVYVTRYRVLTKSENVITPDIAVEYSKTRVGSLVLQACNTEGTRILLEQFEHCLDMPTLASMTFKGYSPYSSGAPNVNRFLSAFPSLRQFSLHISQQGALDTNIEEITQGLRLTALSNCPSLENIRISMPMIYHRIKVEQNRAVWSCCMGILLSAPPTLRVLRIDVECGLQLIRVKKSTATEHFTALDWGRFNEVLRRLSDLEAVELWLGERPWNVATGNHIEKFLSPRIRSLLST